MSKEPTRRHESHPDPIDWSYVVYDFEVRGLTMVQIAVEYGCSQFPVFKALRRAGVSGRRQSSRWSKLDLEQLRQREQEALAARERGESVEDLADFYGYSNIGMHVLLRRARQHRDNAADQA